MLHVTDCDSVTKTRLGTGERKHSHPVSAFCHLLLKSMF